MTCSILSDFVQMALQDPWIHICQFQVRIPSFTKAKMFCYPLPTSLDKDEQSY